MLSIYKVFKAAALAAGIVVTAGTAKANTITQLFGIPTQDVSFAQGFTYQLFDTNLGTLTGVSIRLQTTSTAEIDIFNSTGSPISFSNANASFPLTVTGPPGATTYISETVVAGPISGVANPGPNAFPGLSSTNDSGFVAVPNVDWALNFEAAGGGPSTPQQVIVTAGPGTYSGTSAPGLLFGGSAQVSGTFDTPPFGLVGVTLVYTYTSGTPGAPEPGTWALVIATGSVSVLGLRRRRALKA